MKTVILLPDGSYLSSGKEDQAAISSFQLTESVNEGQELTLGSVCASAVEFTVLTDRPLSLRQGQQITVFREQEGARQQIGIFLTEKPVRVSANCLRVTAYDRVSLLDTDVTGWLEELSQWPYTLRQLATMLAQHCGLSLQTADMCNGELSVEKFTGSGITGRQLMRWIAEAAGCFCTADREGNLNLTWYWDRGSFLQPGSTGYFYENSLSFADYQVQSVEKIQIRQGSNDVGTVYPDIPGGNTYILSGNPLLIAAGSTALLPAAQALYERLKDFTYTPCKLTVPASYQLSAGELLTVTDRNGVTVTTCIMTRQQKNRKDTLQSTGSALRGSTDAVNNTTYKTLSGKVLNLQTTVDGIRAENVDAAGKTASLALEVGGISAEVSRQQQGQDLLRQELTRLEQNAQSIRLSVQEIARQGASSVTTGTGYTFDSQGLCIQKDGQQMKNLLTDQGMYVSRSGTMLLQADKDGVAATDVTVRNYLIVGDHARFENYGSGGAQDRTACFYV